MLRKCRARQSVHVASPQQKPWALPPRSTLGRRLLTCGYSSLLGIESPERGLWGCAWEAHSALGAFPSVLSTH